MNFITLDPRELPFNKKEALRYSGIKGAPTENELSLLEECGNLILNHTAPKAVYEVVSAKFPSADTVDFGAFTVKSKMLYKNLYGCCKAVIFGATLGIGVERLIAVNRLSPSRQLFISACATSMIEEFCNKIFLDIKQELDNEYLRPRFSPGYGDFDISHQKDIFSVLSLEKRLGLTLTDSFLTVPVKTVTAISGISHNNEQCNPEGCEICNKKYTCPFSRLERGV